MNIALVTDSTADIPDELQQAHQIHVIPNLVIIGGKNYRDGIDISRQEFYERLPQMEMSPTTATASSGSYQQLYQSLLENGSTIIVSIHIASALSGVFNAASIAAQAFRGQVHVVDSGQLSMGLGFQVLLAAEAISNGKSFEEVMALIQDVRQRVRVVAMLDTLEYVRRSGRVSWARARIGDLLRIKPFLEVKNSQVYSLGEVRTRTKGVNRLIQSIEALGLLERLAILHTNAEAEAYALLQELKVSLSAPALVVNVTTAIGTHVGPNGLGFAAVLS